MSVLLYDPAVRRHVLSLNASPWAGRRWSVDLLVCDSPFCSCTHVGFWCVPADSGPRHRAAPVSFTLDTEKRTIYRAPGSRTNAVSDSLAEAVARELGVTGWKYLHEFVLGVKQEQIENCDAKRLDAEFPLEVLRGDTSMVGYAEIFPLSPALAFMMDSQRWTAIDDYCVNPTCDCRQVVLQFVTREHERGRPGATPNPPPAMYYDYRDRTFTVAQLPQAHQPSLTALLDGLRGQWPGFESEVKKRHGKLKALFRRALRKYEAAADRGRPTNDPGSIPSPPPKPGIPATAKPGRNDPCPCGSGKKYKKCCGLRV